MGRKPSCECGRCRKCKDRAYQRERRKDPAIRDLLRERGRSLARELRKDPVRRARYRDQLLERLDDPAYREKRRKMSCEWARKRGKDPAYREKRRKRSKSPAYREKRRKRSKDPVHREKLREGRKSPAYRERSRVASLRRRARKRGAVCDPQVLLQEKHAKLRCKRKCSLMITPACRLRKGITPKAERTIDHVTPLADGGPDICANLDMACRSCNSSKGAKPPQQYGRMC